MGLEPGQRQDIISGESPVQKADTSESDNWRTAIGLMAFATYLPEQIQDVAYIAAQSGMRESVERSGYSPAAIDFLALNHMKPSMHRRILAMLDLKEEQSFYLANYGHIGAPDQVLALEHARSAGRLRPGSLIVIASAGLGFTWGPPPCSGAD